MYGLNWGLKGEAHGKPQLVSPFLFHSYLQYKVITSLHGSVFPLSRNSLNVKPLHNPRGLSLSQAVASVTGAGGTGVWGEVGVGQLAQARPQQGQGRWPGVRVMEENPGVGGGRWRHI